MKQLVMITGIGLLSASLLSARPFGENGVYGSSPDWGKAANGTPGVPPLGFVFIKSSEGTSYANSNLKGNMHGASTHSIYAGCYHVCKPTVNYPEAEAGWFWDHAEAEYTADTSSAFLLSPVLDVENTELSSNGSYDPGITLTEWCNRWFSYVESKASADGIGIVQVTYLNVGYSRDFDSSLGGWSWIANLNGEDPQNRGTSPWDPCGDYYNPWANSDQGCGTWRIWQYAQSVACAFSNCQVSYNVANTGSPGALWQDIGAFTKP